MIPKQSNRLIAFALAAGQGRTQESLDILGEGALVKLTNADTKELDNPPHPRHPDQRIGQDPTGSACESAGYGEFEQRGRGPLAN
jgi:hypothetical protein